MLFWAELFIFLGTWIVASFLLQWWNGLRKKRRRYPPSLPSLPIIGSLPFLRNYKNFADFFMRKASELGPIFTFRAGSRLVLILNSKNAIEDALINQSSAFSGRSQIYTETLSNPNSKGLGMMNTSKEYKKYHQLLLSILKKLGFGVKSVMEAGIVTELELITEFLLKENGRSFNPKQLIYLCTTNVITNILFGQRHEYRLGMTELGLQIKRLFESFDANLDVAPILRFLPFHRKRLLQNIDAEKTLQKTFRIKIEQLLKEGVNNCFVSRYLQHEGPDYDAEQLGVTLRGLVAAATDTIANAVTWTLIALANNPDIQNRLREEIDAVIPRDTLPSVVDQPHLPFAEATSLEVMRWKTILPLALPHLTLCDTTVGGYFVPTGTKVLVNLYAAHMDPQVWKDPETFRPNRFLDNEGRVINRESIVPFSLGRRSCIGESLARAELFLLLTGLVQRFIIRPPQDEDTVTANPIEPLALSQTPTEFNIRLIPRV